MFTHSNLYTHTTHTWCTHVTYVFRKEVIFHLILFVQPTENTLHSSHGSSPFLTTYGGMRRHVVVMHNYLWRNGNSTYPFTKVVVGPMDELSISCQLVGCTNTFNYCLKGYCYYCKKGLYLLDNGKRNESPRTMIPSSLWPMLCTEHLCWDKPP